MVEFETECAAYVKMHRGRSNGSRLNRLEHGLGSAEVLFLKNVWWPLFHHFERLYPEYEVRDYREGSRYIDFAYLEPYFRLAIEIDGFGPHWRDVTKWQFAENNLRQNMLVIDGWHVLRFAYSTIEEQPRQCQQIIQQLIGNWQLNGFQFDQLSPAEREIVRLIMRSADHITVRAAAECAHVCTRHARTLLHALVDKRWILPASGTVRCTAYRLHPSRANLRW